MRRIALDGWHSNAVLVLAIVLIAPANQSLAQQSNLKARVEAQQREVRQRIERSRRESEARRRDLERRMKSGSISTTLPKSTERDSVRTLNSKPDSVDQNSSRITYKLNGNAACAYSFVLQMSNDQAPTNIAGVALFVVDGSSGSSARVSSRDNLEYVQDLTSMRLTLPAGSGLLDATLHVADDGCKPAVEGNLPYMLGRAHDWFFPPIPTSVDGSRGEGITVERGSFLSRPSELEKQNRGYFQWDMKITGASRSLLKLRDNRMFRTEDRSQELVGAGQIDFDRSTGLMASRTFRGTYSLYNRPTQISLRINRLSEQQLRDLAAGN